MIASFAVLPGVSAQTHDKTLYELTKQSPKTEISHIDVGKNPLAVKSIENEKVYVANSGSNTVSVINTLTDEKIKDIAVGEGPVGIDSLGAESSDVNFPFSDTAYVANSGSNTVSVIDTIAAKVVAGVKFSVNPVNSGYVECNKLKTPTEQYLYLYSGEKCTAKSFKGFEFQNWQVNLNNNSTLLLNASSSTSTWDSILDIFNLKQDKPEATVSITKFGSFTANFKELPTPLPPGIFGNVVWFCCHDHLRYIANLRHHSLA